MAARVLLIGDDDDMLRIWAFALRQRQLQVVEASSAGGGLRRAGEQVFDLIVIDSCAGTLDPVELCRRLRSIGSAPLLVLTPDASEANLLRIYSTGADECICKPVGPLLFLAKVEAWLRRSWQAPAEALAPVSAGDLQLNAETRELIIDGSRTHRLTELEYRLLQTLMMHPGQTMPTDRLIARVWGSDGGDAAMLKNVIYRLRRKIDLPAGRQHIIGTVPGQGYRLNRH